MREQVGLSSYAYYWASTGSVLQGQTPIDAYDLLRKTDSLGLGVLQICDNVPLDQLNTDQLLQLKENADKRNIILEVGALGLNVDYLLSQLSIASTLGSDLLRIVPWSGSERQQDLPVKTLSETVEKLLPVCEEKNISIAIENYFDLSDNDLLKFVQEFDHKLVGVCLDTANSTGFLNKPIETVETLAPYTVSLHLKDFVVLKKPGVGYWITGAPLGQGWLDVPAILDLVKQAGREPNILIESWMTPKETLEETLLQEESWVQESVDYLHTLAV